MKSICSPVSMMISLLTPSIMKRMIIPAADYRSQRCRGCFVVKSVHQEDHNIHWEKCRPFFIDSNNRFFDSSRFPLDGDKSSSHPRTLRIISFLLLRYNHLNCHPKIDEVKNLKMNAIGSFRWRQIFFSLNVRLLKKRIKAN